MGKVTGVNKHKARLLAITSGGGEDLITKALFAGGNAIEVEAELSIQEGSVGGKNHVASLPGEPPNADTGSLDRNIETVIIKPLHVQVSSNAAHSAPLEFGTSRMAARPFMSPAAQRKRPEVVELVVGAINKVLRGGGNGR